MKETRDIEWGVGRKWRVRVERVFPEDSPPEGSEPAEMSEGDREESRSIEIGIREAIRFVDAERKREAKARYDKRLYNTRLLLKNYRLFKASVQNAVYSSDQLEGEEGSPGADEIRDDFDFIFHGATSVEGIRQSRERTIIILRHIDEMLEVYRIFCERSDKDEDLRRYRAIRGVYVDDDKMTVEEIAESEGVETRTIYRDIREAVKTLSALFFGVDGVRLG